MIDRLRAWAEDLYGETVADIREAAEQAGWTGDEDLVLWVKQRIATPARIATGPKDQAVLVYCEHGPWIVGHYNTALGMWVEPWQHRRLNKPTHWMPLPAAPPETGR